MISSTGLVSIDETAKKSAYEQIRPIHMVSLNLSNPVTSIGRLIRCSLYTVDVESKFASGLCFLTIVLPEFRRTVKKWHDNLDV